MAGCWRSCGDAPMGILCAVAIRVPRGSPKAALGGTGVLGSVGLILTIRNPHLGESECAFLLCSL